MKTTDKKNAAILADLLAAHGVATVVQSPGSRNAPLTIAFSRHPDFETLTVVDERDAAFFALGAALQSGRPVALCCTSGSALLNYAPAVAEAYYRHVPLIIVSADRPSQWIDQDDSQTIRQPGALSNIVKNSYNICGDPVGDADTEWLANRLINDAMLTAIAAPQGPVHINVTLDSPLNGQAEHDPFSTRVIRQELPIQTLPPASIQRIVHAMAPPRKLLVVAGFAKPDKQLNRALARLASQANIAVLTEVTANLHNPAFISHIDTVLAHAAGNLELNPDIVITTGGALVSRLVKEWLRGLPSSVEHWHVGPTHTTVDCMRHLTLRIPLDPPSFFWQMARTLPRHDSGSDYARQWRLTATEAAARHARFASVAAWSDFRAYHTLMRLIPSSWNVHLSNGTPVRYAQIMDTGRMHRCECNRGVSGIDGCTATAIGASWAYRDGLTLLVSGDMSAAYNLSALTLPQLSPRFKMVVVDNDGGGIFRFIGSTSSLPELEERFSASKAVTPIDPLARTLGFATFEASDEATLIDQFGKFAAEKLRPAILTIHTPPKQSTDTLKRYFHHLSHPTEP